MQKSSFLDSYKNNRNKNPRRNKFCGSWTVRGRLPGQPRNIVRYARLGCKGWTCPYCGPRRARQLRHGIVHAARRRNLRRFMTLTLDPRTCKPEESAKYLKKSWAKFRTYVKRKYGKSFTFISITEFQKSGYAHLHVLVDRYMPQIWIQRSWQAVGGGKFVNIRMADIHRISAYLSKYLTKDILLSNYYEKYRRYSTSRDLHLFEKPKKGEWELIKMPINSVYGQFKEEQIRDIDTGDGGIVWFLAQEIS